jgi:predicted nucleic acid-binding protein
MMFIIISNYSFQEKDIVNEFTKKLKKFNTSDSKNENQIFENLSYILSNIHVNNKKCEVVFLKNY